MRYLLSEDTYLVGMFDPGSNVTIQILNLDTNTLFDLQDNTCSETAIPGLYVFSTDKIINKPSSFTNCCYQMQDDIGNKFIGKFIIGGYPDQLIEWVDVILKTETGNWEIKNNQWICYDKDGNELFRFNLYDKNGNLTETKVYKRVRL